VRAGQFQSWKQAGTADEMSVKTQELPDGSSGDSTSALVKNFVECVKSKQTPLCPLEEGHRSTSFAHLANIALATGQRLLWDPDKERFTNSEKANSMLHYEYRKPWTLKA
jgi:hypothetical protein